MNRISFIYSDKEKYEKTMGHIHINDKVSVYTDIGMYGGKVIEITDMHITIKQNENVPEKVIRWGAIHLIVSREES